MKIAISSTGPTLDDEVEARFGRCPYFLIVDSETLQTEALRNPNMELAGGAGPQSAALMADKGVRTVLTGNCGPNAHQAFGAAGIEVITGVSGRVRQAVAQFKSGQLSATPSAPTRDGLGLGGGIRPGGGRGMGGGRRGGGGGGMGGGGRRGLGGGRATR